MVDFVSIAITALIAVGASYLTFAILIRVAFPSIQASIIQNFKSYIKSEVEDMQKNPKIVKEIIKPVMLSLMNDLSQEFSKNNKGPGITSLVAQSGPALSQLAIPFIPKKYQGLATIAMQLFGPKLSSITGETSGNGDKLG